MSRIVFIDTETTGLDPERHEIWEVAAIIRDTELYPDEPDVEWVWQFDVNLGTADPIALNIGRFHERHWNIPPPWDDAQTLAVHKKQHIFEPYSSGATDNHWVVDRFEMKTWCRLFVELTRDAHLFGCVASFDEERLRMLVRDHNLCPMWHYQTHDVEDLAVGYLLGQGKLPNKGSFGLPFNGKQLLGALDIDYNSFERHTALGDAQMARAVFDKVAQNRVK